MKGVYVSVMAVITVVVLYGAWWLASLFFGLAKAIGEDMADECESKLAKICVKTFAGIYVFWVFKVAMLGFVVLGLYKMWEWEFTYGVFK
jgi:hypothetical protein